MCQEQVCRFHMSQRMASSDRDPAGVLNRGPTKGSTGGERAAAVGGRAPVHGAGGPQPRTKKTARRALCMCVRPNQTNVTYRKNQTGGLPISHAKTQTEGEEVRVMDDGVKRNQWEERRP